MDKSTSDEKLLKIIEGTKGAKRAQRVGVKPKIKGKSLLSFPLAFKFKLKFSLALLNKSAFFICGLLTLFFIYMAVFGTGIIHKSLGLSEAEGGSYFAKLISEGEGVYLAREQYANEIVEGNVFLPARLRPRIAGPLIDNTIDDSFQDLALVGVVWSRNPEVMIESLLEQKTYILKKGDIFGQQQYKVKDITRSSAVLEIEAKGEKIEYELR